MVSGTPTPIKMPPVTWFGPGTGQIPYVTQAVWCTDSLFANKPTPTPVIARPVISAILLAVSLLGTGGVAGAFGSGIGPGTGGVSTAAERLMAAAGLSAPCAPCANNASVCPAIRQAAKQKTNETRVNLFSIAPHPSSSLEVGLNAQANHPWVQHGAGIQIGVSAGAG